MVWLFAVHVLKTFAKKFVRSKNKSLLANMCYTFLNIMFNIVRCKISES